MENMPAWMGWANTLFVWFWLSTMALGLRSTPWFVLRTVVVVCYLMLIWGKEASFVSIVEWVAQWMCVFHWIQFGFVFLFPDPRFQRRTVRG